MLALGFLWITGYTNAFNFMDGINGIAGGQALVTCVGMAAICVAASNGARSEPLFLSEPLILSTVIAGAALGFLPHNFPKARMFMGDVGSAPLGFLLAVLALWIARDFGPWLIIPLGLLHANFVLDTGITLVRRVLRGEKWYEAHREHFYQRLIRAGKSHAFVAGWEIGLQVAVLGLMLRYIHAGAIERGLLVASVIAIWFGFFGYCEKQFRKSESQIPSTSDKQVPRTNAPRS